MAFPMGYPNLYQYDVYPKVVRAGRETRITIRPLGCRRAFLPGETYALTVKASAQGNQRYYPDSADYHRVDAACMPDGSLRFAHTFDKEQEYYLDIPYHDHKGREAKERFCVYCVEDDLAGLYPFMGDLHTHTTYSDGAQEPAVVCANYRSHGYDFIAVTDHKRYYPSLEALRFMRGVPTEMTVVPGEEVHLPPVGGQPIDPHIINFGGEYSVNALMERSDVDNVPTGKINRSLDGACPDVMTMDAYEKRMRALADGLSVPSGVSAVVAAGLRWAYDEIRRAGGLGIYVHPMWISDVYHVPDALQDYLVENRVFDAFEVLGGENYYEQNGLQTVRYYQDMARGCRYPVVGSTDSHNSYPSNRNAYICSTILFAHTNERKALMDAVRGFRSVAVDTISAEFRLVGELRLVRYGCFLLKNYFPLHDALCFEEGRMLRQYAVGTEDEKQEALTLLTAMKGRMERLRSKYFAV